MRKDHIILAAAVVAMGVAMVQTAEAKSVCLDNGNSANYGAGGRYTFITPSATWRGTWSGSITSGGSVSVTFPNGRSRNDSFTMIGGKLYLIDAQGRQFGARFC